MRLFMPAVRWLVAATTAALSAFAPNATLASPARPNFVFIYCDDLGFGDLACYGHPHIQSPHLDRMAREGILFRDFTVVNPVCSPSRTGIMTGQFPSRWGVHQHFASREQNAERGMPDWLDPEAPLLSRMLKQAGYRTAHYGKWHLSGGGMDDAPLPEAYGFDDSAVWTGPGRHVFDGTDRQSDLQAGAAHDRNAASWLSVAATDHAVRFIRESKDAPFYINLWLHETHHLVSATDKDKEPYPDTPEPQRTYYAAVTRMDRQVGRILDALDELGLSSNTLVIFSSDNGPENSHPNPGQKFYFSVGSTGGLRGRKRSLLLGGVNVPFIVRWPGTAPAGQVDRTTSLAGVDVLPTLLAAAGIEPPAGYAPDGQNMLAAFQGKPQSREPPVFWWWQGGHGGDDWPTLAMREGPWMLILDETKERQELYRVADDRGQETDLAASEPERVTRMRAAIEAWFATLPKTVDPRLRSQTGPRSRQPAPTAPAATSATSDRGKIFSTWDTDADGKLTLEEYTGGLSDKSRAAERFRRFDKDGDGSLSRDEFVNP